MVNSDLQTVINETLKQYVLSQRNPTPDSSLSGDFEVSFYNGNLLGIHLTAYSYTKGAAHPNKIDNGIHIDLNTGKVYSLRDVFKVDVDYNSRIKELCRLNEAGYRLRNNGQWANWTYDDWEYEREFARSWPADGSFLLLVDGIRVYTIPSFVVGPISGYSVPYSDLMDIIDVDSSLWKAIQSRGPLTIDVELEALTAEDFVINGIRIGDSAVSVVQKLGEPISMAHNNNGISYHYDNIDVIVDSRHKSINIITDEWLPGQSLVSGTTQRGIHPGDPLNQVMKKYGKNATKATFGDYELYEYFLAEAPNQHYILRFAVKQGTDKVSYIGCRISNP